MELNVTELLLELNRMEAELDFHYECMLLHVFIITHGFV